MKAVDIATGPGACKYYPHSNELNSWQYIHQTLKQQQQFLVNEAHFYGMADAVCGHESSEGPDLVCPPDLVDQAELISAMLN